MDSKTQISLLKKEFDENNNSHVFLMETNDQQKCLSDIKKLIKMLISNDTITDTQIEDETYLELIILRPDGKEIKKDSIFALQDRIKTKPILSKYIFYIITYAERMNQVSANKLLKTIEEPNENVIGFLITSNRDLLLPTIKSRCEILTIMYEDIDKIEYDEEIHKKVIDLIKAIEEKNHIIYSKIKSDDKVIKDNFKIVENLFKNYYNTACNLTKSKDLDEDLLKMIIKGNTYSELVKKCKYINKIFNRLTENMNKDLLLEKIFIELKDVK